MAESQNFSIRLAGVVLLLGVMGRPALALSGDNRVLSICELLGEPARYAGKQVSVRAEYSVLLLSPLRLADTTDAKCRVALTYPTDEYVRPKPQFALIEDAKLEELERRANPSVQRTPALGGGPKRVHAVLEGRFDAYGWFNLYGGLPRFVRRLFGPIDIKHTVLGYNHILVLRRVVSVQSLPE